MNRDCVTIVQELGEADELVDYLTESLKHHVTHCREQSGREDPFGEE